MGARRIGTRLVSLTATVVVVLGIVGASAIGLDGWADAAATHGGMSTSAGSTGAGPSRTDS